MEIDPDHKPWEGARFSPREWQDKARPLALEQIHSGEPGIISAIMGAGKSFLIAELCRTLRPGKGEVVVITTSSRDLVDQLYEDLTKRLSTFEVGRYFTNAKEVRPYTIACIPSAPKLAEEIRERGKSCPLWVADEAHKTECRTIHLAYEGGEIDGEEYPGLEPDASLGFTATPFRSDDDEELSLFNEVTFEYTAQDAIRDGVVVPPKLYSWTGADTTVDQACIDMIKEHGDGPGVVNAPKDFTDVDSHIGDAERFSKKLCDAGIEAEAVHSKNSDAFNQKAIKKLEDGDLRCIVHVNMLSEGTDFPFLKWLCLRRPTSSEVRFCQEVGRALRTHPGKEFAKILDPHDLSNAFDITDVEAVLSHGDPYPHLSEAEVASKELDEELDEIEERDPSQIEMDHGIPVRALSKTQAWLRKTRLQVVNKGLVSPSITSTNWRSDPATTKQKGYFFKLIKDARKYASSIPKNVQRSIASTKRCAEQGGLSKGDVSDGITIMKAIKKSNGWPELD